LTKDFYKVKAGSSKSSKGMNKHTIFAPTSPALSSKSPASGGRRLMSLRASDTRMDIALKCAHCF
jgi:hypothetical protein